MTPNETQFQLEGIADSDDFISDSAQLVESWTSIGAGVETVEPILRFMREHPDIDFGSPGPLAHFAERFYGRGYEDALIESLTLRPTALTVWMLNRIINGTTEPEARSRLVSLMRGVRVNPAADANSIQSAEHFLSRLTN